jgi:hypothetical protein
MKTVKFLACLLLAVGFFASCKDDKTEVKRAKTLNYQKTQIAEFKMYVGSAEGGKEVKTTGLDPKTYWKDYIAQNDGAYGKKDFSITFMDDKNFKTSLKKEDKYIYKFTKDTLSILNSKSTKWELFGFGNKNQVVVRRGMYKIKNNANQLIGGVDNNVTLNSLFTLGKDFKKLSDMKATTDTIMYCNIHYYVY